MFGVMIRDEMTDSYAFVLKNSQEEGKGLTVTCRVYRYEGEDNRRCHKILALCDHNIITDLCGGCGVFNMLGLWPSA